MLSIKLFLSLFVFCLIEPVLAQESLLLGSNNNNSINNDEWSQFLKGGVLLSFAVDASLTIILSAIIAFHPSVTRKRDTLEEVELPKTILFYGLVGMIVGFLVVRNGPEIGFVVFGIGTLIRFRTDVGNSKDTGRVILVTLTGLCVGLDIPHIAILSVATAWILIYFLERRNLYKITIRLLAEDSHDLLADEYIKILEVNGYNIVRKKTAPIKKQVEILFETPNHITQLDLEEKFASNTSLNAQSQIDWELI